MALPGTLPASLPSEPPQKPTTERSKWRRRGIIAAIAVVVFIMFVQALGRMMSSNSYAFIAEHGDYPVTWNHCQAIRYQVNPKGAPEDWEQIVRTAIDDIEEASGFVFADRGTTAKTNLIAQRYEGNEWEPVLILWSDRYQDSMLDGSTIGLGGSGAIDVDGMKRYVVGRISLDSNVRDPELTKLTLEHELGHVLGLDHVDDPNQLMHASAGRQRELGRGDIKGLQKLHDVPCSY